LTNFPLEFLLFGTAFFGFIAVIGVVEAHRKKEKVYYLSSMIGFLSILIFALAYLNQLILVIILMAVTGILSIAILPKTQEASEREMLRQRQKADLPAPLKARDFLTNVGWLKLASKHGLWKTMFLIYLLSVVIIGAMLFTLSTLSSFITIADAVISTAIGPIVVIYMLYRPLKKALEKK